MSPLVLTEEVRAAIAKVVKYAEKNPIFHSQLLAIAESGIPVGNDRERTLDVPMNYRVTFSIEQQPRPMSWCKHISISLIQPRDPLKDAPSVAAVSMIMQAYGMNDFSPNHAVIVENVKGPENDGKKAINVLEKIESFIAPHAVHIDQPQEREK